MAARRLRRGKGSLNGKEQKLPSDLSPSNSMMTGRMKEIGKRARQDLEDQIHAEPFEELEDSDLSDWERDQAIGRERIGRERMRRQGLI